MLKKEEKGIWFNTKTGHYQIRFIYKDIKTGKKYRPHIVAQIKTDEGEIRYAQNKDEAKLAIMQYITNGGPINKVILKENTALLADCIDQYEKYCLTLNKSRTDLIVKYCNYFFKFLVDEYYSGNYNKAKLNITVKDIIPNDFYKYMAYRQTCKIMTKTRQGEKWTGRYVSNATIKRELNSIKGLFAYLKKTIRVLKENPCEGLEDLKVEDKIKIPPTPEQEEKILRLASSDYDFFVMLIMFDTLGTRKNEVLNLRWSNVHLGSNTLFPYGYIDFVGRKNNKNLRLPLSELLQYLLENLPRLSEYVFTNPRTGTRYISRYKKLNKILEEANVKKLGIGYHIFRHNSATNMESCGVEASVISSILGNNANVVLNTYLNQGIKRKQEVINLNSERIKKLTKTCKKFESVQEMSKATL